ncbi:MCE family protein [Williamsia sterculiae]|uniref:Phospholipid/cholesterol/gamma-HCH transport system substrate-binding protein n=1 Tax=Williamsia sterculiae TaxID=1344003 RepID=A0A1N7CSI1_9NOCA|nr:MCE family protein [Williamsia sterculiae]SIR66572.1 phospholipid/cholesterol/gamma-HCH transport system substrate-binding protein [Williamsia sterculiae]
MTRTRPALVVVMAIVAISLTGCGFQGLNSLPVPGAQGTAKGSTSIKAIIPSAANLVENAPVLLSDATVGSVGAIEVRNWKAEVTLRLNPGITIPRGSHVMVAMTSVLGSMHLEVVPPDPAQPGTIPPGSTIPLAACPDQPNVPDDPSAAPVADINVAQQVTQCTYPTTEQVLSSLSVVLNGGGLAQIGDIVRELNSTLDGRAQVVHDLIPRLNTLVGDLNRQRDHIVSAIEGLDRLTDTINEQKPTIDRALRDGPQILQLLVDQRPNLTGALDAVGRLSRTTDDILRANGQDIRAVVANLSPVLDQLQGAGPALTQSLNILLTFPFAENAIPQIVRGDYVNGTINLDLTFGRLDRGVLASVGGGSTFYGPEAVMGQPAGAAKRNTDPFTGPIGGH